MKFHLLTRDIERANLIREMRLRTLFLLASSVRHLDGDVSEVGVYKGRSALLLARTLPEKNLHLFDTFTGMPDIADASIDDCKKGMFSDCSFQETCDRLSSFKNIFLWNGVFPQTAIDVRDRVFSLAHFDGDLYQSCVEFIRFFYPRMHSGGVMVFDDYDWPECRGVRKAIEESGLEVTEAVDYQAIVWKK